MRVRLFLSTFQCAFYLPARHEHPHPVPTTQTHPALPLNITHILVTNTHPGKYAEAKIKCQLCPTKHTTETTKCTRTTKSLMHPTTNHTTLCGWVQSCSLQGPQLLSSRPSVFDRGLSSMNTTGPLSRTLAPSYHCVWERTVIGQRGCVVAATYDRVIVLDFLIFA